MQSIRSGGPAWQKTANRIILCWSGMTDTEHNGPYERSTDYSRLRSSAYANFVAVHQKNFYSDKKKTLPEIKKYREFEL